MYMFELGGHYTVKSGYNAIQIWKVHLNPIPSSSGSANTIWKILWGLHFIPRHKTLLCRILNNSFPMRSELSNRGINCSIICPWCNSKAKTVTRVFISFSMITKTLFGSQLSLRILYQAINDLKYWLSDFITSKSEQVIIQAPAFIYSIWHARNQKMDQT